MFIAWKCRSEGGLIALNVDGDENALEKLFAYIFSNAKCVTSSTLRQSEAASLHYSALLDASAKLTTRNSPAWSRKGSSGFEGGFICNSQSSRTLNPGLQTPHTDCPCPSGLDADSTEHCLLPGIADQKKKNQ